MTMATTEAPAAKKPRATKAAAPKATAERLGAKHVAIEALRSVQVAANQVNVGEPKLHRLSVSFPMCADVGRMARAAV